MTPQALSDMVLAVTIIGTITLSIGFLSLVKLWVRKKSVTPVIPNYDPEAIARLQSSIDAISIEVERISEAQRFTTRLLNERVG